MPNHSALAIANEFLKRRNDGIRPSQLLIQKLVYIANGWNLAITDTPLVRERAEAWDNGPVYRSIWDHIRLHGYGDDNCYLIDPATKKPITEAISEIECSIIDHVWNKYGNKSPGELSLLTHQPNTPWSRAYFGRGRNAPLDSKDIKQHYTDLAMAGRGG